MATKFNLGAKIAVGLLGASSIATGSYFTYGHLSTVKISHHISKNNLVLLTANDSEDEWAKRWAEYIEDNENKWKIKNYEELKLELLEVPEEFRNYCLNNSNSPLAGKENTLYKEIAQWCTKSQKVSKLLEGESITLLDTTTGEGDWINAWGRYAENNDNENPLGLQSWPSIKTNKQTLPTDYKNKCGAAKEKEAKNKNDENYLTFKNWCTKQ